MTIAEFPALNATLNGASTLFIAAGWALVRRELKTAHIVCMCAAIVTSSAFLACYLYFHYHVPGGSIHFDYPNAAAKWVYFPLLITHVMLAFGVVPLVAASVVPALRQRWGAHRAVSAYTMPIWLYVSVTGVIVYLMLYRWFPSSEIETKLHPLSQTTLEVRLAQ